MTDTTATEIEYIVTVVTDLARAGFSPCYSAERTLEFDKDRDDAWQHMHDTLTDTARFVHQGDGHYVDPEGKTIRAVEHDYKITILCPSHAELVA